MGTESKPDRGKTTENLTSHLKIPQGLMVSESDTGNNMEKDAYLASNELELTEQERFEQTLEGVGIRIPKSALLWQCPKCLSWNVTIHANHAINNTLEHGSRKYKLTNQRQQPCTYCGSFGCRLWSMHNSRIMARVDANKPKQLRNLRAVAEELNCRQDSGKECDKHDANEAWFSVSRESKQGKGQKYWCMPIRRWAKTVEARSCV